MPLRSPCEDHLEVIQALLHQGRTRRQIAQTIGLSKSCVQAYLQRRKVPGVPRELRVKRLDDARLIALLEEGHTQAVIAERLGLSVSAIERRIRKLGLETARTGPRAGSGHRQKWAGGRNLDKHGYVQVWAPLHPHANSSAYVFEHRLLMEVLLDRYLRPKEVVHHKNDHPRENYSENLERFDDNASHLKAELTARVKATPRSSIPGAYRNNQSVDRCPDADETLAQCPAEIRAKLELWIARHRPTIAHRSLARRAFHRTGAIALAGDQ